MHGGKKGIWNAKRLRLLFATSATPTLGTLEKEQTSNTFPYYHRVKLGAIKEGGEGIVLYRFRLADGAARMVHDGGRHQRD